jgi:membrane protein implicated in regulation of membrane protease activity
MEKILAVAHIFWIYLIPFIVLQLVYAQGVFFIYLVVLVLLLVAALVIDTRNLWRYFRELRSDDALHR